MSKRFREIRRPLQKGDLVFLRGSHHARPPVLRRNDGSGSWDHWSAKINIPLMYLGKEWDGPLGAHGVTTHFFLHEGKVYQYRTLAEDIQKLFTAVEVRE